VNLHIFTNTFPGFEPSWSLSCEMIYYVAWPVLLMMTGMREKAAFWLGLAGSLTVAGSILILWNVFHRMEDRAFVDGFWSVSALFVLWLAGARLMVDWGRWSAGVTRAKWITGLTVAAAATVLLFVMRYQDCPPWTTHLAAWAAMPGLVLTIAGARHLGLSGASARVKAACRWLGLFSYPCYILHDQMLRLVDHYAEEWLPASWARMPLEHLVVSFVVVLPPLVLAGPALERFFMGWRTRVLRQVAAKAGTKR
jgi:peptidoglycan/LPS O-acetylase OafA/YrhL